MSLPTDRDARNALPVWDGCIAYFPDVWAEVAKVSVAGNKQHALGAKLHWDTTVSTDHKNKAMRHMLDDTNGEVMDSDDTFHLAKALWRIAAALQLRIWERDGKDEHGKLKDVLVEADKILTPLVSHAPYVLSTDTPHPTYPYGAHAELRSGWTTTPVGQSQDCFCGEKYVFPNAGWRDEAGTVHTHLGCDRG